MRIAAASVAAIVALAACAKPGASGSVASPDEEAPAPVPAASDECDGLLPPPPGAPVTAELSMPSARDKQCLAGLTDGSGAVLLGTNVHYDGSGVPYDTGYSIFDPTGAHRGDASGMTMSALPEPSGFIGREIIGMGNGYVMRGFAADGTVTAELPRRSDTEIAAQDPTGGVMVVVMSGRISLEAYDAALNLRWRTVLPTDARFAYAVGVDLTGHTLALLGGNARSGSTTVAGMWIDAAGNPGEEFDAYDGGEPFDAMEVSAGGPGTSLTPRAGTGLFLARRAYMAGRMETTWLRQFDTSARTGSPPPEWLTARRDALLQVVRRGKGYALVDAPQPTTDCVQRIEILAPSGKSCGSLSFRVATGACETSGLSVGLEGTVIQQRPLEFEKREPMVYGPTTCTWRWWPALLR